MELCGHSSIFCKFEFKYYLHFYDQSDGKSVTIESVFSVEFKAWSVSISKCNLWRFERMTSSATSPAASAATSSMTSDATQSKTLAATSASTSSLTSCASVAHAVRTLANGRLWRENGYICDEIDSSPNTDAVNDTVRGDRQTADYDENGGSSMTKTNRHRLN